MKKFALPLLLLLVSKIYAQHQMLHYNLRQIPQTYQWNPALMPQYKFYWGTTFVPFALSPIPIANSLYISKGTAGPAIKDFIMHKGDSVQVNTDVVGKAKKMNYTHYNIEMGILSFGYR